MEIEGARPPASRHGVSALTMIAFATGHVLNDMCASMWFTYFLIFFHSVLKFENAYAGVLLLAGQIADGLSTVFVGVFINDTGRDDDDLWLCNRYGKSKSWHLVGTVCVLASFPFVFMPCFFGCEDSDHLAQLVYFAACVIVFQFGWAAVQISHLSMIPVLSPSENERTGLTSARYAATVLANTAVYCVTWGWFGLANRGGGSIGPDDAATFRNIALICLAIGGSSSLLFHLTVRLPDNHHVVLDDREAGPLAMTFADWLKEPQLYQVAMVYMSTRLFVNVSQSYMPFYLQETLKEHAIYIAIVPLVTFVSGFVVALVAKRVTARIGTKTTFAVSCLVGIAACAWIFSAGDKDDPRYVRYEIHAVAVLVGAAGSGMLITSLTLTADLIGNNLESSAFVYGVMSTFDKLSNGIAIMTIQKNIPVPCGCSAEAAFFKTILVGVCGGVALFSLFAAVTLLPVQVGQRRRTHHRLELPVQENNRQLDS